MLPLNDPLWKKLDDAHRDRVIPDVLAGLADDWDDETANSLFWDCLCHQETCYGATYAAVPHLLEIAEPEENRHQRLEIALFLGFVVLCALDPQRVASDDLRGLPRTAEEWDRKLDDYRDSLANLHANLHDAEGYISPYEKTVLLPRYTEIVAIGSVNARDLEKIESIRADFFSALPLIRASCERALLENLEDEQAPLHLLSGIAAADGLLGLAFLLSCGAEGRFKCRSCDWKYTYTLFGERVAIYADDGAAPTEDRRLQDYKEGTRSRADGFMVPAGNGQAPSSEVLALLALADRASNLKPGRLLRNFLGSFLCRECGKQGPIQAV